MKYPELAEVDSTDRQNTGLEIAFKTEVGAGTTKAASPGAFLAGRVVALLEDYEAAHVTGEQLDRIFTAEKIAFERQDFPLLLQVATLLGVDLDVDPKT